MHEPRLRLAADPAIDPSDWRRILAVRLDNVGDVVMLGPALRAIRTLCPDAGITLLCSPAGSAAAALLPWVDETIEERTLWQDAFGALGDDPARELALANRLREGDFDAAFLFTSFSQSPWPPAFIAYLAGIPVRVGQSGEFGGGLLTHAVPPLPAPTHQVDRNLRLLAPLGISEAERALAIALPPAARASARALIAETGLAPDGYLVASPGASCAARRYPVGFFVEALRRIAASVRLPIVVTGTAGELPACEEIAEAVPGAVSLAARTTLAELAALIADARLLVASHSGPMHLADAVATPAVVLFSGTDLESQWEPRSTPAVLLRRPTDCAPCGLFTCPIGQPCLAVPPAEVARAAENLLAAAGRRTAWIA